MPDIRVASMKQAAATALISTLNSFSLHHHASDEGFRMCLGSEVS